MGELAAEEEVGDDVEVVAEGEVLEHGGDAEGLGRGGVRDGDLSPSKVMVPPSGV